MRLACERIALTPSGSFPANTAWLACAAITYNLLRAAGSLASLAYGTLRRDLIDVAARAARHRHGHITLHLRDGWHREQDWTSLTDPDPVITLQAQTATSYPASCSATHGQAAEK